MEDSIEKWSALWCTYVGEKGRTLGKTYGIKARCCWEHPWGTHWEHWELIGHLMGTHLELEGTCWEQRKNEKNAPPNPPHPKLKRKKMKVLWVHASAYALATCIFGFQNCWSPFLASTNGRGRNWTRKKNKKQISTHWWMVQFFSFSGGRGRGIFSPQLFPMCSHYVSKGFPSSQWAPIKFPNCSQMHSQ